MARPTIIAGNWKLNPPRERGMTLCKEVQDGLRARAPLPEWLHVAIFPPYPFLGALQPADKLESDGLELGAQDVAFEAWGAFTGEIGAPLLGEFGVRYAIVGHSERRHVFGESDSDSGRKVAAASAAGLTPILCVGETEPERESMETFEVVERQLAAGLEGLPKVAHAAIAYEPVWAIGTGRTATPEMASEVHRFVRNRLEERRGAAWAAATPILYGGSVKPENAAELLGDADIDGALVGGASLEAGSFLAIVDAAIVVEKTSG